MCNFEIKLQLLSIKSTTPQHINDTNTFCLCRGAQDWKGKINWLTHMICGAVMIVLVVCVIIYMVIIILMRWLSMMMAVMLPSLRLLGCGMAVMVGFLLMLQLQIVLMLIGWRWQIMTTVRQMR